MDLNFVCPEIQESEVGEGFPTVLHQEDTIDARVVKLGQFGEVVRKTYLKQTMSEPHRPHSYLQDQFLYEAAILKSLADVIPVIGWFLSQSSCEAYTFHTSKATLHQLIQ